MSHAIKNMLKEMQTMLRALAGVGHLIPSNPSMAWNPVKAKFKFLCTYRHNCVKNKIDYMVFAGLLR